MDTRVWSDSRAAADVLAAAAAAQEGGNKGVCEEAVVQRLETERDEDAGAGFVDGRSEAREAARGSGRWVVVEVGQDGGGGEEEGSGDRGDCDAEYNDAGGEKESGEDGDKTPVSSFSISLSNFTSPGGSTPYL